MIAGTGDHWQNPVYFHRMVYATDRRSLHANMRCNMQLCQATGAGMRAVGANMHKDGPFQRISSCFLILPSRVRGPNSV